MGDLNLFSKPKVPTVAPAPVVPTREDPAIEEARERAKQAAAKTKGRGSTFLTGATGLTGDDSAIAKKTLLGE